MNYYLAVDIGASSGRHILGSMQDGKLVLEEVHRFKNGLTEKNGHLCWDFIHLFSEIKKGLKKCSEIGKIPVTMGIDTWGVDFVLLDKDNKVLGDTVAYRDKRTEFMMDEVSKIVSDSELYERTGIQKQSYNTIYQLLAIHKSNPEIIENATTFLMTPEYFNFLLTGEKKNEYTIASTTGLLNPRTHEWDMELIEKLGYKKELFKPLNAPKTVVGGFTKEVQDEVGFDCTVILPPTHDTASAVLSVPATTLDNVYISSGTWSLMGVESMTPNCTPESQAANLTNEGGIDYRFRYLKNIMGLWIIQFIKREYGEKYSFNDLEILARENADFNSKIDVNDSRFLSPKSMIAAVQSYCSEHNMRVPETVGEIMQCAYISLAYSYSETVKEIEKITKHTYQAINIVGGGSQDGYLNELTAKATGKTVYTGPVEATALGNILTQMLSQETVKSVDEAREIIRKSFDIKKIEI